jgi:hypothetical protein
MKNVACASWYGFIDVEGPLYATGQVLNFDSATTLFPSRQNALVRLVLLVVLISMTVVRTETWHSRSVKQHTGHRLL